METGRGREGDVTKETESRWIKIIHVPWRQEMLLWRLEEGGREMLLKRLNGDG